ncbi:MAG: homoserine kinase [Thermotaleaceae bacterium]
MNGEKRIIKVPATTANLGPGFDTMGMALQMYNEIEIEPIDKGIDILGFGTLPLEDNLVFTAMEKVLKKYGKKAEGLRISGKKFPIPMSRGLGSSAAAIVAGICAANYYLGDILSQEDIINYGTEMEGHPDNIVPAVVGGLTVSIMEGQQVIYTKVQVPEEICFAVMVPQFTLSTHAARSVLPVSYEKKDCIFNISRAALLVAAMEKGEIHKLCYAVQDRIHQPYRLGLIPNSQDIFDQARAFGSLAEVISGSGSTLLAMVERKNITFKENMAHYLKTLPGGWAIHLLDSDREGVRVL